MLISISDIQLIYDKVLEQLNLDYISVIIFVSFDTDAVCTLKILTGILRSQNIQYEIYPVASYLELEDKIEISRSFDKVKMIFFINCGGTLDLTDKWFYNEREEQEIKIFLLDVNKPINHANIEHKTRNAPLTQIKVVNDGYSNFDKCPTNKDIIKLMELENQPQISDSDDDDDEDLHVRTKKEKMEDEAKQKYKVEDNGESGQSCNSIQDESNQNQNKNKSNSVEKEESEDYQQSSPLKRKREIKKRLLDERKLQKTMLNEKVDSYYSRQFSSFPSSMIAFRLARDINKASNNYLWLGMIGLTSLFMESKLTKEVYDKAEVFFSSEMMKLNSSTLNQSGDVGMISKEVDFRLSMLRHWSLYESMRYSPYIVTKMRLWDDFGVERLNDLITQIGLSLEEAKQLYSYMSTKQKNDIKGAFFKKAVEFDLLDIYFNSFKRQVDTYHSLFCSDYCWAITTALEMTDPQVTSETKQHESRRESFWTAYHLLDEGRNEDITHFMESYKTFLKILVTEALGILEKSQIHPCLEFSYVKMQNDTPERQLFEHPFRLVKLGQLLMSLYHEKRRSKNKAMKPLVISIEAHDSPIARIAGVVPETRNPFGAKFIAQAEKHNIEKRHDGFMANVIEIKKEDLLKFVGDLHLS